MHSTAAPGDWRYRPNGFDAYRPICV